MMRRPVSLGILALGLLCLSCQRHTPPPAGHPSPPEISSAVVTPAGQTTGRDLLGQVQTDPRSTSQVMARISGISVLSIDHFPGDRVRRGERVMVIMSPDFFSAESEFSSLLSSSPGGDVRGLKRLAIRKLRLLGASREEIDRLEKTRSPTDRYEVRAPRSGTLMRVGPSVGTRVAIGDLLFVVSDLRHLWVSAFLYPGENAGLSKGTQVQVFPLHDLSRGVPGTILRVAPFIDPQTRTIPLRIGIDNSGNLFRPDAWVHVRIPIRPGEGEPLLRLSAGAVVRRADGKTGVFLLRGTQPPRFVPVKVLGRDKGEAVVSGNLAAGDRVVVRGLLPLLAEENARIAGEGGG